MKIRIGADHGGFELREALINLLKADHEIMDRGAISHDPSDDYPDFAKLVANDIASRKADFGILICTTGIGMSITANKVTGVRAALVHAKGDAKMARAHNNANVLVLGSKHQTVETAITHTKEFINTDFEGGRHARRLSKMECIVDSCGTPNC